MKKARRGLEVGVVVVAAIAVVGLVSGVENSSREVASHVRQPAGPPVVAVDARSYLDMRARAHGPNAGLPATWWTRLRGARPDLFATITQTAEDREAALARRASRRAYDGAPPGIPHAIDQLGVPACLACHGEGLVIAELTAPVMSHPRRDSCVQCHVVIGDPRPGATTPPLPPSTFVGLAAPRGGERAWVGAPPTIPHGTWMRERCESCHGALGALGMRTSHPWRAACTQCHAPSAVLDQRAPAWLGGAR